MKLTHEQFFIWLLFAGVLLVPLYIEGGWEHVFFGIVTLLVIGLLFIIGAGLWEWINDKGKEILRVLWMIIFLGFIGMLLFADHIFK
jgi:hypothetical protein